MNKNWYRFLVLAALAAIILFAAVACGSYARQIQGPGLPSPSPSFTGMPSTFPTTWSLDNPWGLPRQDLSPGAIISSTDASHICPHVDPALEAARPSSADKANNYSRYGLSYPQPFGLIEDDHVVPIELNGQPNNQLNLYPEPNTPPDPAMEKKWGLSPAFVHNPKDILEDVLHQLVCAGKVELAEAQTAIATNWPAAYTKYVVGINPG